MNDKVKQTKARIAKYALESAVAILKSPRFIDGSKRLEICKNCEHFNGGRCGICKCFMSIKTKFAATKCPLGKW